MRRDCRFRVLDRKVKIFSVPVGGAILNRRRRPRSGEGINCCTCQRDEAVRKQQPFELPSVIR